MQLAGPRGLPTSDIERKEDRSTTLPPLQTNSSLRLETPNAGSGCRITQQVLHILLPTTSTGKISGAADSSGLEQASSVPFLQRNRESSVSSIQKRNLAPMTRSLDLGIDFGHGVKSTPKPFQSL